MGLIVVGDDELPRVRVKVKGEGQGEVHRSISSSVPRSLLFSSLQAQGEGEG